MTIDDSIKHWDDLANEQDRLVESGLVHPAAGRARAETYRRTAESLRIEQRTGVAVCSCCFKPFGKGVRV